MCGAQDKNTRDLLMHLHDWHEMLLDWYRSNMDGVEKSFLPDGYSWKTTPELNANFWKQYQDVSLAEAKRLVAKSHAEVMEIVNKHSDEDLFTKGKYKWTGTTSLGAYLISATSSHYDWAIKQLKKM